MVINCLVTLSDASLHSISHSSEQFSLCWSLLEPVLPGAHSPEQCLTPQHRVLKPAVSPDSLISCTSASWLCTPQGFCVPAHCSAGFAISCFSGCCIHTPFPWHGIPMGMEGRGVAVTESVLVLVDLFTPITENTNSK